MEPQEYAAVASQQQSNSSGEGGKGAETREATKRVQHLLVAH